VTKAVLIGAVLPLTPRTPANPGGMSIEAFDHLHAAVKACQGRPLKVYKGSPHVCAQLTRIRSTRIYSRFSRGKAISVGAIEINANEVNYEGAKNKEGTRCIA
jgi:hypothetical protein